jgi:hypothetical protein
MSVRLMESGKEEEWVHFERPLKFFKERSVVSLYAYVRRSTVARPADPKWWEVLGESLATIFSEFYAPPTMSVSGFGYSLLEDCSETCLSRLNPRTRSTRKTVLCTVCGGLQSLEYLPDSISHELALSIFRKLKYLSCSEKILEYWLSSSIRPGTSPLEPFSLTEADVWSTLLGELNDVTIPFRQQLADLSQAKWTPSDRCVSEGHLSGIPCVGIGGHESIYYRAQSGLLEDDVVSSSVVNTLFQVLCDPTVFRVIQFPLATISSLAYDTWSKWTPDSTLLLTHDLRESFLDLQRVLQYVHVLFVPVPMNNHWMLICVDPRDHTITFMDPLKCQYRAICSVPDAYDLLNHLVCFLQYVCSFVVECPYSTLSTWKHYLAHDRWPGSVPHQELPSSGCAMHCLCFAIDYLFGQPLHCSNADAYSLRLFSDVLLRNVLPAPPGIHERRFNLFLKTRLRGAKTYNWIPT